jgi:hypothetical protein
MDTDKNLPSGSLEQLAISLSGEGIAGKVSR